jgi:hypothetical protein
MANNTLISKCCNGCSHLVREKCEKSFQKSKQENFIYCNTQNTRLLIELGV